MAKEVSEIGEPVQPLQAVQLDSGLVPFTPYHAKKAGGGRLYCSPQWVRPDGNTWMAIKDFVTQLPDNGWRVDIPGRGSAEIHPDATTKLAIDNAKIKDNIGVHFGPELDISTAPDSISYIVTLDNATQLPNGDVEIAEIDGIKIGMFFEDWRNLDENLVYDKGKFTVDLTAAKTELADFGETTISLDPSAAVDSWQFFGKGGVIAWADLRAFDGALTNNTTNLRVRSRNNGGGSYTLNRCLLGFDLSALGAAASATLQVTDIAANSTPDTIHVSDVTPQSVAAVANDANFRKMFDAYGADPIGAFALVGGLVYEIDVAAEWNNNIGGDFWLGLCDNVYDVPNNEPVPAATTNDCYMEKPGSATPPVIDYVLAIYGIEVWEGLTELADGISTIDFGDTPVGINITKTITIKNTSNIDLTIIGQPAVDSDFNRFTISSDLASLTINPGETGNFDITFNPTYPAISSGTLTILSDNPDEGTFTFFLTGTATSSEIATLVGKIDLTPTDDLISGDQIVISWSVPDTARRSEL